MAQPIYELWQARYGEAWHQLTPDEQEQLGIRVQQALADVGGRLVVMCSGSGRTKSGRSFGVEELPDLEALQHHTRSPTELNWWRYVDCRTTLGTQR